jgi:hypothetical protein
MAMADVLSADASRTLDLLFENDSPQLRRQLFRDHFAAMEGTAFGFKEAVLSGYDLKHVELSLAELALTREETYELENGGAALVKSARLRFAPNFLFALRMLAKMLGREWVPPTDDHRWGSLQRAARVRDRLMHPKRLTDLDVTDEDLLALAEGYDWYWRARGEIMTGVTPPSPGNFVQLLRIHGRLTTAGAGGRSG